MTDYRLSTDAERQQFYQLYLYAFNQRDSPERQRFFFARYDHALVYGLQHDDQLTSGLYSLPFTVNFHGVDYRMNGIGDVMSAPEFSGKGGAGTLIKAALNDMADMGVTLSYLAPFAFGYYRRFGYEQVFNHMVYTLPTTNQVRYQAGATTGQVTRATFKEALSTIKPFFAHLARHLRGGIQRPDWWWSYLTIKHDWLCAIYRDEHNVVQGYLLYARSATTLTVHEWQYQTGDAFSQLAAFILKHVNTVDQIVVASPHPRYLGDVVPDPDAITATVKPYMMTRIVDLQDFINRYPFTNAELASLTIHVEDNVLERNNGCWQLSIHQGHVQCRRVGNQPDGDADISASIQALTKILFGARTARSMMLHGEITGTIPAVERLDQVVVKHQPELIDYF